MCRGTFCFGGFHTRLHTTPRTQPLRVDHIPVPALKQTFFGSFKYHRNIFPGCNLGQRFKTRRATRAIKNVRVTILATTTRKKRIVGVNNPHLFEAQVVVYQFQSCIRACGSVHVVASGNSVACINAKSNSIRIMNQLPGQGKLVEVVSQRCASTNRIF